MKKIVGEAGRISVKDDNGIYLPTTSIIKPKVEDKDPSSIDDLLKAGIQNIAGIMRSITSDVGTGAPSRETIQNLKDVMGILKDLKKEEKEFLDSLSDEELERLSK